MMQPALIALSAALRILGTPALPCPEPAAIEAALDGLMPGRGGAADGDGDADELVVRLSVEGEAAAALVVRVEDARGRLLSERRLRPAVVGDDQCRERAQEVAVVVAAAAASLRGPMTAAPPIDDPRVAAPRSATSAPAPVRAAAPALATAKAPPPPASAPSALDVAAMLGVSRAGGTWAPAAEIGVVWAPLPRLGLGLGALFAGAHAVPLGAGEAVWSRWGLAASLGWRSRPLAGALEIEARVAGVAAARVIDGRSFPETARAVTFDPGATAGLRVGRRPGRAGVFAAAALSWWLRDQGVFVRGSNAAGDLPRWEVLVGVGAVFGGAAPPAVTSGRDPT